MSQRAIAAALGVDKQTISRWERGERVPAADLYEQAMATYRAKSPVDQTASRGTPEEAKPATPDRADYLAAAATAYRSTYLTATDDERARRWASVEAAAGLHFGEHTDLKAMLLLGIQLDVTRPKAKRIEGQPATARARKGRQ